MRRQMLVGEHTHTHNLIMEIDKAVLESCFISRIKTQSTLK